MRWQCPYCPRDFSKSNSLSRYISQSHPYINDKASQTDPDEQVNASIYDLPDYSSSYDSYTDEFSIIYGVN
jgi:hypothetical protein